MRGFFIMLGAPAGALDDCISRSQWQFDRRTANGLQISCYHMEMGDRVSWEIFIMDAEEAPRPARDTAR
jgi:hypothetical protein